MDSKTYYVSVQAGSILENQGDAAYEFEIQATADEVQYLNQLLAEKEDYDNAATVRGFTPALPYHQDDENVGYDNSLREIYACIHRLGNDEAKTTIDAMGLERLGTPYPE